MMEDLLEWSAGVMGWFLQDQMVMVDTGKEVSGYFDKLGLIMYQEDWHPDLDLDQCFKMVKRMRELGWAMNLSNENAWHNLLWTAEFLNGLSAYHANDTNPALAILKAAKATGV